jgi:hypothetical protein
MKETELVSEIIFEKKVWEDGKCQKYKIYEREYFGSAFCYSKKEDLVTVITRRGDL